MAKFTFAQALVTTIEYNWDTELADYIENELPPELALIARATFDWYGEPAKMQAFINSHTPNTCHIINALVCFKQFADNI